MPSRRHLEAVALRARIERGDPYWPAQLTVALVIALNLVLPERVTIGPKWLVPAVAGGLLLGLVIIAPARAAKHVGGVRRFALSIIGLVSAASLASLGLLVHYLINGGTAGGHQLIYSGVALWGTNVLLFAVWYWELDRGGPATRFLHPDTLPDFQFPQMENPQFSPPGWRPGFIDYLYLSLTNATAFSPTDTMPLTQTAKAVMALQSIGALLTVGLVVARAVNILG
ncbi:MAG: hypothetical protein QOD69_1964 [Solirubrobacteraceae bacterium]|jgi:uncharacterized membrane protein|nr:hypothetical protein [Solirubrobacteraceae bacterium]